MSHPYNPRERHSYTFSTLDGQVWASATCSESRAKSLVRAYTKALGHEVRAMVLTW